MSWTNPISWSDYSGSVVTAAMLDEQLRDNLNTLFPFTGAGQIPVSSDSANLTVIDGSGSSNYGQVLRSGSSGALEFGSPVYAHMGGNAHDWTVGGNTAYYPSKTIIQTGTDQISVGASSSGNYPLDFAVAFSGSPIVIISVNSTNSGAWKYHVTSVTKTGFSVGSVNTGGAFTPMIFWMSVGEV